MKTLLTDLQHSIAQAPEHRHCHMTCEMVYVKRGKARFSIAGVDYTAGPGCLVLISPLEEHSVRGGLGGAVAEVLCQKHPVKMRILGLPDETLFSGTNKEVFQHYGLTAEGIVAAVKAL